MVDLSSVAIEPDVLKLIPMSLALEMTVLPLSLKNDTVIVAMPEMFRRQLVADVQFLLGKKVKAVPVPKEILVGAIHRFYEGSLDKFIAGTTSSPDSLTSASPKPSPRPFAPDASTITIANRLIGTAIKLDATDIHLEPYGQAYRVRYRVDGVLHEAVQLPADRAIPLISRLKNIVNLRVGDSLRPQEGRVRLRRADRTIDMRVSTFPMGVGEKLTVQLSDKSQRLLDLAKLGLEGRDLELFQQALRLSSGLILVTGPEGSGKLTTLYAALTSINRPDINIITIEDAVQFDLPGVNQTKVRPDLGLTYSDALRVILRQDPNVICLSELRDTDTTRMAVRAAEAGHLVLSALHSIDAISAIGRLLEIGIEPFLLGESLRMIIAQRLVRRLCPQCKIPVTPTPDQIGELPHPTRTDAKFFGSKGCPSCHHFGYRGRTGAFEVLPITPEFSALIAKGATVSELRQRFQEAGLSSLRSAALLKAERGETSLDEALRATAPLSS